jgi:hypothetical protein
LGILGGSALNPLEVILAKRAHLARLANEGGARGEIDSTLLMNWQPRPRGPLLRILIEELAATGALIKGSSFDAIHHPTGVDFADRQGVREKLGEMVFIEIKTANQDRVRPGFDGFFFALTESEIAAAEVLGSRHRVALYNNRTSEIVMTSVPEIIRRAKSMTWQLSVQL